MEHTSAGPEAGLFSAKFRYERHRPTMPVSGGEFLPL